MTSELPRPSLRTFEREVSGRDTGAALKSAIAILEAVNERYGRLDRIDLADMATPEVPDAEIALVFCTRFAAAFGALLADPSLNFTPFDYERLLLQHRWIDVIFSVSGFRSSDYLLPSLANAVSAEGQLRFDGGNLLKFLLALSLNSNLNIDFDQIWQANRVAAALAFLQYLSSRYVFEPRAFALRERLLEWLPDKLSELKLGSLTLSRLPEIYMHCSYAIGTRKHAIKRALIQQMRRACLEAGIKEYAAETHKRRRTKPLALVVAEHFTPGHAVYRTHSRAVAALRERFHVVGLIYPNPKGTGIEAMFDECLDMSLSDFLGMVKQTASEILSRAPDLVFYLGVGMAPQTIALASLRLAPVQCVSFGHTATTMSDTMDYFVLPEDFVGAPEAFSEKILALPKAAMPMAARPLQPGPKPAPDGVVRIAVPASAMKINPLLIAALAEIAARAKTRINFQIFPLAGIGVAYAELAQVVAARVPNATVFPEMPHDAYMQRLNACDFFLSPFPYGNMNSIVDAFRLGLPGIALDGKEAHSHADSAIFRRIGLPDELIVDTVQAYIAAAVRLADDTAWRQRCTALVRDADLDHAFFAGDARLFADAMAELIARHAPA